MKDLEIARLNPILKSKLVLWDRYKGKNIEGYERILSYLSDDGMKAYFNRIMKHDKGYHNPYFKYTKNNPNYKYVLEDNNEPMAFMSFRIDDINHGYPRIYLSGIAVHPLHQNEGYASKFMGIILKNPEKYMGAKPAQMYALVDSENFRCKHFLQKLGNMKVRNYGMGYERVYIDIDYDKYSESTLEKGK